jgi:sugar/nucleoside kinase (ribokinase family)
MRTPLALDPASMRYEVLIGTGGIGSGEFFALRGNHTIGREESRPGRFDDRRDYCKLHIICHYVRTLAGPRLAVYPVGRVGDDETGLRLLREMGQAGLELAFARAAPGARTLRSICFTYPDGSGGNLTTDDSASALVSAADVAEALPLFGRHRNRGIALAVPEVPLEARAATLESGRRFGFLTVASFLSAEMDEARERGLLDAVDLLAMNVEEAARLAPVDAEDPQRVITAFVEKVAAPRPRLMASITAGRRGSWVLAGGRLAFLPALAVTVRSAAGAGDAHLAGILCGLAGGLDLFDAHEIGRLVAAASVTSPHTIHPDLDRHALRGLARALSLPQGAAALLGDGGP